MAYSKWLKVDLHIHSHKSKDTKENDYDGEDLTYDKLTAALTKEKVNFFSITDHNTINVPLYQELLIRQDELIKNNLNFLIGSEIDFFDEDIHTSVFHMLVYFNSNDLTQISKVFTDLYGKSTLDEIDKNVPAVDLKSFFNAVFNNSIQDIITIPHFNNKDRGIPPKDQIDKFVYTVFNALEDSNNRSKLIQSIKVFKNCKYNDVPVVAFSDNHNIKIYPSGKDGNTSKQISMYMLGNIYYPFSSVKSAFQDVNTRLSIDEVEMRRTTNNQKYIKSINIGDNKILLSAYQNTIIGGFGTGKSFLLDMIKNGKQNVNKEKYGDLANQYSSFNITFSDNTTRACLNEVDSEVKIISFEQYKDIYFKNILLEEDKIILEKNLHIKFPELNIIEPYREDEIINSFSQLEDNYGETSRVTDIISYDTYSHRNEKSYSFKIENNDMIFTRAEYYNSLIENMEVECGRKISGIDMYQDNEKSYIQSAKNLIEHKNTQLILIAQNTHSIMGVLDCMICDKNKVAIQSNENISSCIKIVNCIKDDISTYIVKLNNLKKHCLDFESRYSHQRYNELKNIKNVNQLYTYKLIAKYKVNNEFQDFKNHICKSQHRKDNLFKSIISTINNKDTFAQGQKFEKRLDTYTQNFYSNFNIICYDIYDQDVSIMKKSAGEKANIIINIIFNIIEENSKNNNSSIVLLDQPEDNLDNKGIQRKVVDRIRDMKSNNTLPQFICVTHNANISITADSENIILAKKDNGKCSYIASGIEDTTFINDVCKIVEGGQDALKKRGTKFNIPMIKILERT